MDIKLNLISKASVSLNQEINCFRDNNCILAVQSKVPNDI